MLDFAINLFNITYINIKVNIMYKFYISRSVHPSPLPESLKKTPNPTILMWKRDWEEQKRIQDEREHWK
jgi:hypothetical protein